MKYISKKMINATKTKTRVQREVDYMRMLRHPHIIKLSVVPTTAHCSCAYSTLGTRSSTLLQTSSSSLNTSLESSSTTSSPTAE